MTKKRKEVKKMKNFFNKHGDWTLFSIICVCAIVVITLGFTACNPAEESNPGEIKENYLTNEQVIEQLETENEKLREKLSVYEKASDPEKADLMYMVTLKIKQVHYTLDITEHIKDGLNDIEITIPVDKQFYEEIEEGDTLNDDFRWGSLLSKGSFGKWKVIVKEKSIQLAEN